MCVGLQESIKFFLYISLGIGIQIQDANNLELRGWKTIWAVTAVKGTWLTFSRTKFSCTLVNFFLWMGTRAQVVQAQHTAMPYAPKEK